MDVVGQDSDNPDSTIAAAGAAAGDGVAVDLASESPVEIAEEEKRPTPLNRRAVTGALMLVMVLASMEQTVTSTAMPTIIGSLHGLEHYAWVASIYLLACTVSMPLYGRLADALGRKRVILFSITLFSLSSMLAGMSHSMGQLIVLRGMQGLGAGGIMPVVLTILGDIFTLEERAKIQGLFSSVWGTSALAGPMLGWLLVSSLGWRSIFYVNLPFGLLGMIVLMFTYRDVEKPQSVNLDLAGIGALAAGCMALLALLSRLGPGGWSWQVSLELAAAAGVAGLFFLWHERRCADPALPLELLMDRSIGPSLLGSCLLGMGFLSLDTFVPLYVQGVTGGGVGAAAWVVTPVMLTWAMCGPISARLVVRYGFRSTALLGSTVLVIGFGGLLACTTFGAPRSVLTGILALTGFGLSPVSMSLLLAAQNAVSWQRRGMVTSSVQFFRTIGGSLGIGILGAAFNVVTQPMLRGLESAGLPSPAALLDPHTRSGLPPEILHRAGAIIGSGLRWVFIGMLAVALFEVLVMRWMPRRTVGHRLSAAELAEAIVG